MSRQNFISTLIIAILTILFFVRELTADHSYELKHQLEQPDTVVVASFNIRIFSHKSRNTSQLGQIAHIVHKYDIVALQEVMDEGALKELTAHLKAMGLSYKYIISPLVGEVAKEHLAFIYNTERVKLLVDGALYNDRYDQLDRDPYFAVFKVRNFDFIMVNVHTLWDQNLVMAKDENKRLADVYKFIQEMDNQENDIILLGDFNLEPQDRGFVDLKNILTMQFLIKPPQITHLSFNALYDNIWVQEKFVKEYKGASGIDMFDKWMFDGNIEKAIADVSDHRPIWAAFNINGEDDD